MQEVNSLLFGLRGFSSMEGGGVLEGAHQVLKDCVNPPHTDVKPLRLQFLIGKVGITHH